MHTPCPPCEPFDLSHLDEFLDTRLFEARKLEIEAISKWEKNTYCVVWCCGAVAASGKDSDYRRPEAIKPPLSLAEPATCARRRRCGSPPPQSPPFTPPQRPHGPQASQGDVGRILAASSRLLLPIPYPTQPPLALASEAPRRCFPRAQSRVQPAAPVPFQSLRSRRPSGRTARRPRRATSAGSSPPPASSSCPSPRTPTPPTQPPSPWPRKLRVAASREHKAGYNLQLQFQSPPFTPPQRPHGPQASQGDVDRILAPLPHHVL
ncbi:hypothetical protein DIPPA_19634 [Diplonema papillatum]|nr:hypothetical protein DIPPA_19634 [Diplonema papillatum]